jgi:hypothetical protein
MLAAMPAEKSFAQRLLLKPGAALALVNAPAGHAQPEGTRAAKPAHADAVLLYAASAKELAAKLPVVEKALPAEARLWIAYPKAGQLGTDLDREELRVYLQRAGFDAVRQIAIDETWSAMWFKRL